MPGKKAPARDSVTGTEVHASLPVAPPAAEVMATVRGGCSVEGGAALSLACRTCAGNVSPRPVVPESAGPAAGPQQGLPTRGDQAAAAGEGRLGAREEVWGLIISRRHEEGASAQDPGQTRRQSRHGLGLPEARRTCPLRGGGSGTGTASASSALGFPSKEELLSSRVWTQALRHLQVVLEEHEYGICARTQGALFTKQIGRSHLVCSGKSK